MSKAGRRNVDAGVFSGPFTTRWLINWRVINPIYAHPTVGNPISQPLVLLPSPESGSRATRSFPPYSESCRICEQCSGSNCSQSCLSGILAPRRHPHSRLQITALCFLVLRTAKYNMHPSSNRLPQSLNLGNLTRGLRTSCTTRPVPFATHTWSMLFGSVPDSTCCSPGASFVTSNSMDELLFYISASSSAHWRFPWSSSEFAWLNHYPSYGSSFSSFANVIGPFTQHLRQLSARQRLWLDSAISRAECILI